MKIFLATDHAGFELKNKVKAHLESLAHEVVDCGAHTYEPLDDYPDYIAVAAKHVSGAPHQNRAIIFGGSGQGEAMLANRFPNVRATVFYGGPKEIVTLSREHNDSNILSFGARFVAEAEAIEMIDVWLATMMNPDEKYIRRVKKAEKISSDK